MTPSCHCEADFVSRSNLGGEAMRLLRFVRNDTRKVLGMASGWPREIDACAGIIELARRFIQAAVFSLSW